MLARARSAGSANCGEASSIFCAQILIEGFPTDAKLAGQRGFPLSGPAPVGGACLAGLDLR